MKTTLALIIGTTLLVASSAQAGGYAGKTGWYVGADAGLTRNNSKYSDIPYCPGVGPCRTSTDKSDSTWRARAGYQFNENWGVEGAYEDLGQTYSGNRNSPAGSYSANQETTAWTLAAIGKAPISQNRRIKAYGKLGISRWESKNDWRSPTGLIRSDANFKDKGTDPVAGVGLEYDVSNQWTVRGGYDRHFNVGKTGNGSLGTIEKDVDALTIGASFNF
ncbi:MAG: porin family protein [Thiotrichaceae bacterium]|uniref:Porin family protein n=1 Tax=Candidatus Thiocaldithrix dubininis TaxID=3080823 RepID=A0AA95KFF5_9GAMM|nr:MAG: porin family protein [Candidatus Thiocaldithrix dubininis]